MHTDSRDQIIQNYNKAKDFHKRHAYAWFPLLFFYALLFITALLVDWGMSYAFFAGLAMDPLNHIPPDMRTVVLLESLIPLAAPIVFKETYVSLPLLMRRAVLYTMAVVAVLVVVHLGNVQLLPIAKKYFEQHFPETPQAQKELAALLGEDAPYPVPKLQDKPMSQELQTALGKDEAFKHLWWFALTFLLMSFLGCLGLLGLARLHRVKGALNKAKDFLATHQTLQDKEREFEQAAARIQGLASHRNVLCRAVQDVGVQSFLDGLTIPKTDLNRLKFYGDKNRKSRLFSFFQIWRAKWLVYVDIENAEKMIGQADESVRKLKLVEPVVVEIPKQDAQRSALPESDAPRPELCQIKTLQKEN